MFSCPSVCPFLFILEERFKLEFENFKYMFLHYKFYFLNCLQHSFNLTVAFGWTGKWLGYQLFF